LLKDIPERPFVRRVREPWRLIPRIPGARLKRLVLNRLGRVQARRLERDGFPGCDWMAGITDPPFVADPAFFSRWLANTPGQTVELMCHPGHFDRTLIGRDCVSEDESLFRRVRELELLRRDDFLDGIRQAGFDLAAPDRIGSLPRLAAA
jgi:hypothetical protein